MKKQAGFTLLEMLITLGISSILLTGLTVEFATLTKYARDVEIKGEARESVRTLLDMIGSDIRNAASGMPLGQQNFTVSDATLGNAPIAVLETSTSSSLSLRLNELGQSTMLTAEYDLSDLDEDISVMSSDGFAIGDIIYFSEITSGGDNGARVEIKGIPNSTTLTIDETTIVLPAGVTTIRSGSLVSKVDTITISNNGTTITRSDAADTITLAPNANVSFSYLDSSGNAISPLTISGVANQLAAIGVTVTVVSDRNLSDGTSFKISESLNLVPRNLLIGG